MSSRASQRPKATARPASGEPIESFRGLSPRLGPSCTGGERGYTTGFIVGYHRGLQRLQMVSAPEESFLTADGQR